MDTSKSTTDKIGAQMQILNDEYWNKRIKQEKEELIQEMSHQYDEYLYARYQLNLLKDRFEGNFPADLGHKLPDFYENLFEVRGVREL